MKGSDLTENIFSTAASKLECFPAKLQSWLDRSPFVPVTLELQPTERCNHRCPKCQAKYALSTREVHERRHSGADIDWGLLDSIWESPPDGVILSGNTGDPLLYPKLPELLERLGSSGVATVLLTNGEAMTPELARVAIRVCRGIRVSLDGHDASSFGVTHGRGAESWERVLDGVRDLVSAKSRVGGERSRCQLGVGYLTGERTLDGMLSATRLAKRLGVDYIQFRPFHGEADFDLAGALQSCSALEEPPFFRVYSSHQKYSAAGEGAARHYSICEGAHFYALLDARGDFYMCCHHVGNASALVGSLNDGTWTQFVNSPRRRRRVESFDIRGCMPVCRLHSHNEMLVRIRERGKPACSLPVGEIAWHAPIL